MSLISVHDGSIEKPDNNVRFVCVSDTHCRHNFVLPEGDVLLHGGDFSNHGSPQDIDLFNKYLSSLPFQHKVVIAGNHDICFDVENQQQLSVRFGMQNVNFQEAKSILTNCIYLEDSGCQLFGYNIWGSPWQPEFFDWAFNLPRGAPLAQKWEMIPPDTDILITHGPPYGFADKTYGGLSVGCEELIKVIDVIKPKVHVFGHIHEGYGIARNDHTVFINASTCTLRYRPENKPIVFDLPIINN